MPLNNNRIGFPLIQLQSVDSTNNYAMERVHAGMAHHGTAVVAAEQTRGKGQRNKDWQSSNNENLLCSIVIEPEGVLVQDSFLLSMAIAVAAEQLFNKKAGEEVRIKWPNDIYWRDRKAGGILIENVIQGPVWKFAVAGIGLNINQTAFGVLSGKAVSLKQITGTTYDLATVRDDLFAQIDNALQLLQQDRRQLVQTYHEKMYRLHETVQLKKENRVFPALIKGVAANGALITQTSMEEQFAVGEVEWLP